MEIDPRIFTKLCDECLSTKYYLFNLSDINININCNIDNNKNDTITKIDKIDKINVVDRKWMQRYAPFRGSYHHKYHTPSNIEKEIFICPKCDSFPINVCRICLRQAAAITPICNECLSIFILQKFPTFYDIDNILRKDTIIFETSSSGNRNPKFTPDHYRPCTSLNCDQPVGYRSSSMFPFCELHLMKNICLPLSTIQNEKKKEKGEEEEKENEGAKEEENLKLKIKIKNNKFILNTINIRLLKYLLKYTTTINMVNITTIQQIFKREMSSILIRERCRFGELKNNLRLKYSSNYMAENVKTTLFTSLISKIFNTFKILSFIPSVLINIIWEYIDE